MWCTGAFAGAFFGSTIAPSVIVIMIGLGVNESYVPLTVTFAPTDRLESWWHFLLPHRPRLAADRVSTVGRQLYYERIQKHRLYVAENGQDLPEVRNWKWAGR